MPEEMEIKCTTWIVDDETGERQGPFDIKDPAQLAEVHAIIDAGFVEAVEKENAALRRKQSDNAD